MCRGNAFGVFGGAEDAVGFAEREGDAGAIGGAGLDFGNDDVDEFAFGRTACLENDVADEGVGDGRRVEVGAALEAVRGVGVDDVAFGGAADGALLEPGSFDEDVFGLGGDHGVPSTHDAGEADGFLFVGNDEVVGIEGAFDSIEGAEFFAFAGAANDDAAFELVEVEGVGGMAHAEGAVVGGVDGVGDELLLEEAEALGDGAGGLGDGDVAKDLGGEAAAEGGLFDGDGKAAEERSAMVRSAEADSAGGVGSSARS